MSGTNGHLAELDDLLSRLVEGTADASDRARLAELLRDDIDAQRMYVSVMSMHGWLAWDRSSQTTPAIAPAEPVARRIGPAMWSVVGLAAAMLIVATVWIVVAMTGPAESPAPQPTGPVVAVITDTRGVAWNSVPMAPGDELRAQTLDIADGRVVIEYLHGSTLTLDGPAEFDLRGAMRARLNLGWAGVRVSPGAEGFAVETPAGVSVVDLGTEFGVRVEPDGGAEVIVYDGSVELVYADRRVGSIMVAGEAQQIGRDGALGGIVSAVSSESVRGPVPPHVLAVGSWDRDGDLGGWKLQNVASHSVVDGELRGVSGSGSPQERDAFLMRGGLNIDARRYPFIELRYRAAGPNEAHLFFGKRVIEPGTFVNLGPNDGEWRTVLVDLRRHKGWAGTIQTLRLDPVSNVDAGEFSIDTIRLHAADPTDGSLAPIHTDSHGARVYSLDPPAAPEPKLEEDGPAGPPKESLK